MQVSIDTSLPTVAQDRLKRTGGSKLRLYTIGNSISLIIREIKQSNEANE